MSTMITRFRRRRRRAISAVMGALMFFAMMFTVGFSYIYTSEHDIMSVQSGQRSAQLEKLELNGLTNISGYLQVNVNNTGSVVSEIRAVLVDTPSEQSAIDYTSSMFAKQPNARSPSYTKVNFPIAVPPGEWVSLQTNLKYASGQVYVVKLVTAYGNVFATDYPPTATSLAAQALSSGAIGDLYLKFSSYTYYTFASGPGCPSSGGYSGVCLVPQGQGFAIPASLASGSLAFSITLTDLNPSEKTIVLDQFSLIYQTSFYGAQHTNTIPWYIVSNGTESNGLIPIDTEYTPIVLKYDVPVTVFFASSSCIVAATGPSETGCKPFGLTLEQSPGCSNSGCAGSEATVFILSNGWELVPPVTSQEIADLSYSTANYGQNSPFVSTLYY